MKPPTPDLFGVIGKNGWEAAWKEFWAFWPYKVATGKARETYRRLYLASKLPDNQTLREAVEWQQQAGCLRPLKAENGRDVRPHPSTWLNGERWLDERPVNGNGNGREGMSQAMIQWALDNGDLTPAIRAALERRLKTLTLEAGVQPPETPTTVRR